MKPRRLAALFLLALAALLALPACSSAPPMPTQTGRGVAARGGDAESDLLSTDTQAAGSYMGDAIVSSVRNEDRVQSTNAAPTFALNLATDVIAATRDALAADVVLQSIAADLTHFTKARAAATDANALAAAEAGITAARAAYVARADAISAATGAATAGLANLKCLVYAPIYFQSAGEAVQRLDAPTATAAAQGLANALAPILEAVK